MTDTGGECKLLRDSPTRQRFAAKGNGSLGWTYHGISFCLPAALVPPGPGRGSPWLWVLPAASSASPSPWNHTQKPPLSHLVHAFQLSFRCNLRSDVDILAANLKYLGLNFQRCQSLCLVGKVCGGHETLMSPQKSNFYIWNTQFMHLSEILAICSWIQLKLGIFKSVYVNISLELWLKLLEDILTPVHGELLTVIKNTVRRKQQQVKLPSQKAQVCFEGSVDIHHKPQSFPRGP